MNKYVNLILFMTTHVLFTVFKGLVSLSIILYSNYAVASLNEVDKAFIEMRNIIANPGFEAGRARWTVTDPADVSVVTSGSELLLGKTSITWDSDAAAETLCTTSEIPQGMYGKPGLAQILIQAPSGSPTHVLSIENDGSPVASGTISANATPTDSFVTFTFPSSGNLSLCLETVAADEPSITLDSAYLGENFKIFEFESMPENSFSAKISAAGVVSDENVDWINGNCTVDGTPSFNCDVSGLSLTTPMTCTGVYVTSATGNRGFWKIRTDTHSATNVSFGINGDGSGTQITNDSYIMCQKAGADYVTSSTDVAAFKADQLAKTFIATHNSDCAFTNTGTTPDKFTGDASCTFNVVKNTRFGSITSAQNAGLNTAGIIINPGVTGEVEICVTFNFTGSSNQLPSWYLTDGIVNQAHGSVRMQTNQNAAAHSIPLCGIFDVVKGSSTEINIFGGVGTGSFAINAATSAVTLSWTGKLVNVSFPAPYIPGVNVNSADEVWAMESAYITSSGTPSISTQSGDWIDSLTDNGTGDTTLNISDGKFSIAPICVCSPQENVATPGLLCTIKSTTTSAAVIKVTNSSAVALDRNFMISCHGPR